MKRTMNPALGAKRKSFFLFCFTLIAALLFPVLPAESAYWKDLYHIAVFNPEICYVPDISIYAVINYNDFRKSVHDKLPNLYRTVCLP